MRRSTWNGCSGQPQSDTNYHRTHCEHVTKVTERPPYHAGGGAVQHHHVVHKESFEEEVDGGHGQARRRYFKSYPKTKPMAMTLPLHHGGGSHHYETYQETYEETFEEDTYSADRHHGSRDEYQRYEETYEVDEEVVVGGGGGGGCAQLKRGCRAA